MTGRCSSHENVNFGRKGDAQKRYHRIIHPRCAQLLRKKDLSKDNAKRSDEALCRATVPNECTT
ncbi:hypothetical protein BWQ96_00450 [Gracilariopsis chorda]|uniref:Uncharacterized protein n=1 Tax=Gracilariopsis chorda TaxID=448386 RepID=A0A2V3J5U3_9FLOR|nr:hypothetical protein BWQ96_00450 [Gracilariopsis chorda]|eukprot:PXF49798.1 hypothetical protein BWQ96_00450 [Gracilariopsis chorda]